MIHVHNINNPIFKKFLEINLSREQLDRIIIYGCEAYVWAESGYILNKLLLTKKISELEYYNLIHFKDERTKKLKNSSKKEQLLWFSRI